MTKMLAKMRPDRLKMHQKAFGALARINSKGREGCKEGKERKRRGERRERGGKGRKRKSKGGEWDGVEGTPVFIFKFSSE